MICAECGAPIAGVTQVCAECGAALVGRRSVVPVRATAGPGDGGETAEAAAGNGRSWPVRSGEAWLRVSTGIVAAVGAVLIIWACALPVSWVSNGVPVSIFSGAPGWFAVEPVGVAILGICAAVPLMATRSASSLRWLATGALFAFGIQTILLFVGYPSGVGMFGGLMLVAAGILGAVISAAGQAAPAAASAGSAERATPVPFAPGHGGKVPAQVRRVLRTYVCMACVAVVGCVALGIVSGRYYPELTWWEEWSSSGLGLAGIALFGWAIVLSVQRIRFSRLIRQPSDPHTATVIAGEPGKRTLTLEARPDASLPDLEVRLARWTGTERPPLGESVTFYGRPTGGPLLVTSSRPTLAFLGTGKRRAAPSTKPAASKGSTSASEGCAQTNNTYAADPLDAN